ncbi:hypothetical protein A6U96_13360 [Agrobacterium tumefaciens]|nr:hypothetical protein A6U96_13360 [Agrobacterium tumefaciens]
MAAFAIAAMSYMYALFVNMYDNLYYMLVPKIKAICARCAQFIGETWLLREILRLDGRKSDGRHERDLCRMEFNP